LKYVPVIIIAEIGVNHNGSINIAKELVSLASKAGADVVKFQTFKAENLVTKNAPKADYQIRETGAEKTQFEMLKALELSTDAHHVLIKYCEEHGVSFLSTPFDLESFCFLTQDLKQTLIKVGSGDMTNAPLLLALAKQGCEVIMSTGMSTLAEVEAALGVLAFGYTGSQHPASANFAKAFASIEGKAALNKFVTLMHCTTEYPAPMNSVNLLAMDTLRDQFGLKVGFSDHTQGSSVALAAVARGACIIEKHITLDKTMDGPDHAASMEPDEFVQMIKDIRAVEQCLGEGVKQPDEVEIRNRVIARKSLVAACNIEKGQRFTEQNLTTKRPNTGISALNYFEWIGQTATRAYDQDGVIDK